MPAQGARKRAVWGSLTRVQIVDAAERAVREGGVEQLTIRGVAASLGVAPMSLYRHVRHKDDLLVEVVDRLLSRRWRPRVPAEDWRSWTIEAVTRFRDFLLAEPAALHVYLRHPIGAPSAIRRMQAMHAVLTSAGLSDEASRRAYAALHTYTIGFAALEASRRRSASGRGLGEADVLGERLDAFTSTRQFLDGLGYLIEGIERERR